MKTHWLDCNRICLAMGNAVARNLMFESKQDHELFFKYWKKYLGGMATLLNYHLSPTGWTLLIKTKSKEEIIAAYHAQRSQSKKAKKENTLKDAPRILSEHFRIFLSQFVRRSNAHHRRKGCKVMQRFHKYVLKDGVDYEYFFEKITKKSRRQVQIKKKYQANLSGYDTRKEMTKDSAWKVGTRVYLGLEKAFQEWIGVELIEPKSSVLRKYLNFTTPLKIRPNSQ